MPIMYCDDVIYTLLLTSRKVFVAGKKIDYFLANNHLWFTDAIKNSLEETHASEHEDTPRSRSGQSEGTLSRRDEEAYKRQLGNMKISMEGPSFLDLVYCSVMFGPICLYFS